MSQSFKKRIENLPITKVSVKIKKTENSVKNLSKEFDKLVVDKKDIKFSNLSDQFLSSPCQVYPQVHRLFPAKNCVTESKDL